MKSENSFDNKNRGKVIWFFGRPSSGKTTIGTELRNVLETNGIKAVLLDGDELRKGINSDLEFSILDRNENIRRTAEVAKILALQGCHVICSVITPLNSQRELVKKILPDISLFLIYINTSLEECFKRDKKGHYKQAANGTMKNFTGVSSPFEEPLPDTDFVKTTDVEISESVKACLNIICSF